MTSAAGHPRPLLRRDWTSLDGTWDFAWDDTATAPGQVAFDAQILVPFAPEAPASGLGVVTRHRACWYRRTLQLEPPQGGDRVLVHFGAVDHAATVWLDGVPIAHHEGGSTPFHADVTAAADGAAHELVVHAVDDPADLGQPRGKQDWEDEPHKIWYPRTTGIWQTVWLETVPAVRVAAARWSADVPAWALDLDLRVDGAAGPLVAGIELSVAGEPLARQVVEVHGGAVRTRVGLQDGGLDIQRGALLWAPEHPTLIDARITLRDRAGTTLDVVETYTAMREVRLDRGRFWLNGRPRQLRLVLDQGYWPQTGMTPPDLAALERDVELTQALGFNGVRKHQKVEDPRFLRVADERGLLVWGELPSAYRFDDRAAARLTAEWTAQLERDRGHPSIVAWVPFNESWGVPDIVSQPRQRDLVAALFHLAKALDGTRPVVGNDGWELDVGDLLCVHDYADAATLARRYGGDLDAVLATATPGDRVLLLDGARRDGRPVVLSEFGGVALTPAAGEDVTWGYDRVRSPEELVETYAELLAAVHAAPELAGFCYTQLTDTYQEANGLLTADREVKADLPSLAAATRGER